MANTNVKLCTKAWIAQKELRSQQSHSKSTHTRTGMNISQRQLMISYLRVEKKR